ncbi:unnamed protein product [Dicrocoelium dendriticum]|nr:unnamed protein product [Dicrocoelium dendriticum]
MSELLEPSISSKQQVTKASKPVVLTFSFIVPSGTIFDDVFRKQPKMVKYLERNCFCKISVGQLKTQNGMVIQGACLVEVKYDENQDGHNAFIQFMHRIARMMKGLNGHVPNYSVVNTTFS